MRTDEEHKEWVISLLGEKAYNEHYNVLWGSCKQLPCDYTPWGDVDREKNWTPDCSCGCKWYRQLDGPHGADWGVCVSPNSARRGLLTFEHQCGADCFEQGEIE